VVAQDQVAAVQAAIKAKADEIARHDSLLGRSATPSRASSPSPRISRATRNLPSAPESPRRRWATRWLAKGCSAWGGSLGDDRDGAGVLEEVHHQVAHRHDATCG
jgi:hypothetical protein